MTLHDMTNAGPSTIPDPTMWISKCGSKSDKAGVDEWSQWLRGLIPLTDVEWLPRARQEALEAFSAGRMARTPSGPPPQTLVEQQVAEGWLQWAALDADQRFATASWTRHITPWVHGAASMLGFKGAWRHPHLDAGMMAVLLMLRLDMLRNAPDLPLNEKTAADVDEANSRANPSGGVVVVGRASESDRARAVWRECVLIRQYLADMLPLAQDLPRGARGPFKRWWFASLEWTRIAEKMGARMWSEPVQTSRLSTMQITWQRWFGKLAFR